MSTASQAQASAYWRVTQCPGCDSSFKVSPDALAAASGKVRCGACLTVFVAEEHLLEVDPILAEQLATAANTSAPDDAASDVEPDANMEPGQAHQTTLAPQPADNDEDRSDAGEQEDEQIEENHGENYEQGSEESYGGSYEEGNEDDNDSVFIGSAPTDYFDPSRFLSSVEHQADQPASNNANDDRSTVQASSDTFALETGTDEDEKTEEAADKLENEQDFHFSITESVVEDHLDEVNPESTDTTATDQPNQQVQADEPVSPEAFSLRASFSLTAQRHQAESDAQENSVHGDDGPDAHEPDVADAPDSADLSDSTDSADSADSLDNTDIHSAQAESPTLDTASNILEQRFHAEQESMTEPAADADSLQSGDTPADLNASSDIGTSEANQTNPDWRASDAAPNNPAADSAEAVSEQFTEDHDKSDAAPDLEPDPEPRAEPEAVDQSTEAIRARALQAQLDDDEALEAIPQEHLAALGEFSTPVQFASGRQRNWGRQILWSCVSVLLLTTLAAQYFWQHKDAYSLVPSLRPWYVMICEALSCQLPVYQNISAIRSETLAVRSHPELSNGLVVNVEFRNTAAFPQPFPILVLSFNSPSNSLIALREFSPKEYLGDDLRQFDLMPVMNPVQLDLEIIDPGPDAVNYTMAFRRP